MPTAETPAAEVARLRAEIRRHDRAYYVEAAPTIADRDYDRLMARLAELEAADPGLDIEDSPTHRVGGAPIEAFATVTHAVPMLSIENTYDEAEVREWADRVRRGLNADDVVRYVVELKVDGVAISLRYEGGRLVLGATRGDGTRGDDVTANLRTVRGIPAALGDHPPRVLEVRGEVYMTHTELLRLNAARVAEGEAPLANPRNTTAGTLKQLDPRMCAKRRLKFVAHGLGESGSIDIKSYTDVLTKMRELGIPTSPETAIFDDIDGVIAHAREWATRRTSLDYPTDGLVIKVDDLGQRARLGSRSKSPRWVIAYKYEAEQAVTRVEAIAVQVGRTGKLTPVAELLPVQLAGTTVRRATLHNADEIARKDVRVGDAVIVQKAGEIIPQVVGVQLDQRVGDPPAFVFPDTCPSCGAPAVAPEGEVDIRCTNPATRCPEQLKALIQYFAGRKAMDIEDLGEKLVQQLVDKGMVKGLGDLYRLDEASLADLDRMGKKSAANLVASLERSKSRPLDRFLAGLGIRHVGQRGAEVLAARFGTLEAARAADLAALEATPGLGGVVAGCVFDFFADADHAAMVDDLLAVGVRPPTYIKESAGPGSLPLAGRTFVITGTLPVRSRAEAEALIKSHGGKVTGAISKSTSYLLAGVEAGSKLAKANALGIEVVDEVGLEAMVGLGGSGVAGEAAAG